MKSELAYIGRIIAIIDIPNADHIQSAVVVCGRGGRWQGVVRRGEFQVDDRCEVYLPDAILPQDERFRFMEAYGYRVVPRRFRGARSEVLIVRQTVDGDVGDDITQVVGVSKHEKPIPASMGGDVLAPFPVFIPRTDEPHFQSVPEMIQALQGRPWVATTKIDGTSATFYRLAENGPLYVCSRNYIIADGRNLYWNIARYYDLAEIIPPGIAVQGEIVGPNIQKNPLGLDRHKLFIFSVFDIENRTYIPHAQAERFARDKDLPFVREAAKGRNFALDEQSMLALAESQGTTVEGIVFRPYEEELLVDGKRLSFKVLNLLYKH